MRGHTPKTKTTTMKTNGSLKRGDWIWVRGRSVRVVAVEPCVSAPMFVTVLMERLDGKTCVETMHRNRQRKVVV